MWVNGHPGIEPGHPDYSLQHHQQQFNLSMSNTPKSFPTCQLTTNQVVARASPPPFSGASSTTTPIFNGVANDTVEPVVLQTDTVQQSPQQPAAKRVRLTNPPSSCSAPSNGDVTTSTVTADVSEGITWLRSQFTTALGTTIHNQLKTFLTNQLTSQLEQMNNQMIDFGTRLDSLELVGQEVRKKMTMKRPILPSTPIGSAPQSITTTTQSNGLLSTPAPNNTSTTPSHFLDQVVDLTSECGSPMTTNGLPSSSLQQPLSYSVPDKSSKLTTANRLASINGSASSNVPVNDVLLPPAFTASSASELLARQLGRGDTFTSPPVGRPSTDPRLLPIAPLPPIPPHQPCHPRPIQLAPQLTIAEANEGICLQWTVNLRNTYCEPATTYEIYSYTSSELLANNLHNYHVWKKVGDVAALPLPMACTLTHVQPNNMYYFIVRSIDRYKRISVWSNVVNAYVN